MTERGAPRAPRRRRPSPAAVALGSVAAFLAILALLAFQLRAGRDPALSRTGKVAQVLPQPRRLVVVRRVEDDYVITRVVPAPAGSTSSAQPAITTGSSGGRSATATAPAPAVSSSPIPTPAPVATPAPVTRTS